MVTQTFVAGHVSRAADSSLAGEGSCIRIHSRAGFGDMSRPCATTLASELADEELAALRDLLIKKAWKGKHLEIGTAAGGTLCAMIQAATHRPPFVVIDPMTYFEGQRQTVERNLREHGIDPADVSIRQARSWDALRAAKAAGERFDFIFVDGTHKFRYVIQDMHWAGLLNVGGVMALHDYLPVMPGVRWAADHFLRHNPNYKPVGLVHSLLLIEKVSADRGGAIKIMSGLQAAIVHGWLQISASVRKRLK